jgi:tetratricopeptide (TPR) repeat protein
LGIDPEYPWAYYGLGRVLADQERFDEAIEQYRKADELWQKDRSQQRQRVLLNWGRALRLKERYEQAAEKYRETIGIDPECPWAYYGLGRVLVGQERFDDAIEQYRKADELWQKTGSKDRKFALRAWADALRLQEHYDEAVRKYQEAIGIDPGYPAAYNNFGNALLDQERFDEAIEQYRKADELWQKTGSKDRKFALSNWADALRLQKHYEQAAEKYREAIGIDSEYPDAYNGLGAVLADQERFDEAIEQYRKADELWQKTR